MIYLVGGAPRAGKTTLGQQVSARLKIGWITTDVLYEMLLVRNPADRKDGWNAAPEAITAAAEDFYPYLERFVWGISGMTESYLIDGVDFLPGQVDRLSNQYPIRAVFLGCSQMTLGLFDHYPGRSKGYAGLPVDQRRQIVHDVPLWSEFVRQEAARSGYPYVDTSDDFAARLDEAERLLTDRR
jgi:hypothetical protein